MAASKSTTFVRWSDLPGEQVNALLERRFVTGEKMMLARIHLQKGCLVPRHTHENEQISLVLEGALRFSLGPAPGEERVVRAGEALMIPGGVPHQAEALEDTVELDVFSPPRQDWIDGTDQYLRGK